VHPQTALQGITSADVSIRPKVIASLFVGVVLRSSAIPGKSQVIDAQTPQSTTPVGRWRTVDGVTSKAKSVIAIWAQNGKLYGRIEKLIDPDPRDPDPRCDRCDGELKGRPLIGLRILWDLQKDGERWSGGQILDPENGKTYKCSITMEDNGRKLKVRGFIGLSLLGRTEHRLREE